MMATYFVMSRFWLSIFREPFGILVLIACIMLDAMLFLIAASAVGFI